MLDDKVCPSALNEGESPGRRLAVRNLVKRFGDTVAVNDVSFDVPEGCFLSLLGPSGSGKTTVMRLLGGFEIPDRGQIEIDGTDICPLPAYRRDIGVVFQRYALFPHMSVADNVGFSLRQRGVPKSEQNHRVNEALDLVGLTGYGARRPNQLSGGEQQRVALARALVFKPRILLMDEPLAALDKRLRERLQQEIRALQRRLRITTVYVTHDQAEAFAMSDLVAVMHEGRIEQVDTPRELYEAPRTRFVAQFVGDSNILRGEAIQGGSAIRLADGSVIHFPELELAVTNPVLLVRPEMMCIGPGEAPLPRRNELAGTVTDVTFLGEIIEVRVAAGGQEIVLRMQSTHVPAEMLPGRQVTVSWPVNATVVL